MVYAEALRRGLAHIVSQSPDPGASKRRSTTGHHWAIYESAPKRIWRARRFTNRARCSGPGRVGEPNALLLMQHHLRPRAIGFATLFIGAGTLSARHDDRGPLRASVIFASLPTWLTDDCRHRRVCRWPLIAQLVSRVRPKRRRTRRYDLAAERRPHCAAHMPLLSQPKAPRRPSRAPRRPALVTGRVEPPVAPHPPRPRAATDARRRPVADGDHHNGGDRSRQRPSRGNIGCCDIVQLCRRRLCGPERKRLCDIVVIDH